MNGIGSAVRRGLPAGCLALTLIAGTMAACSGGGGSGANSATSAPSTTDTGSDTSPSTEGTGPESPGATASGVSVSLPSLPIGGAAVPEASQCLGVAWNGTTLIEGATVVVMRVEVKPDGTFRTGGSGCSGEDCASFVFRPGHTDCVVALTATAAKGQTATLTLRGAARCATEQRAWCDSLAGISGDGIPLQQPGSTEQPPVVPSPPTPQTEPQTQTPSQTQTPNS